MQRFSPVSGARLRLVPSPSRFPSLAGLVLCLAAALPARAQIPDSAARHDSLAAAARRDVHANAHVIRWYEVVAVVGGVAAVSALDEPVQRWRQDHRSDTSDDIAAVFRRGGEPLVYATVSLGTLGAGVVLNDPDVQRAGGRLVTSVALSAVISETLKRVAGRSRPNEGVGAFRFHPFTSLDDSAGMSTRSSLPSGHTTAAFAVATSLAEDFHNPYVSAILYTLAGGTAFSRVNDNRHWLSDTVLGAALGVTSAKLVSGHWRIFGLRPPHFLVTPTGATTLSWGATFRIR
jgi:membrane-associated phospholipid phosphatase